MRRTAWTLLPFMALLLCAPLLADEPKSSFDKVTERQPEPSTTVRGTVVASGGSTLSIETPAGNRMDFEVDPETLPSSVVSGAEVLITYGPRETGVGRVLRVAPVAPVERVEPVSRLEPAGGAVSGHGAEASEPSASVPRPVVRKRVPGAVAVVLGLGAVAATMAIWLATRSRV